jgi:ribosomal protein S27E
MGQQDKSISEDIVELHMDHGRLLNWRCPDCGNVESFSYEATVFVEPVSQDNFYYDGTRHVIKNKVQCLSCQTDHTVAELIMT